MSEIRLALSLLLLDCGALATEAPPAATKPIATKPQPARLAFGVNDLGEQLRVHISPDWAVEERFQMGSASSNEGAIQALLFGLRGYRFFSEHRRCKLYLGAEGAYAQTQIHGSSSAPTGPTGENITQQQGFGNTTGFAAGGFAGIEFRPFRRIAVDLDMGPYFIRLKEKTTSVSDSNWDFVLNAAVLFYFF